jgi:hypothetical protein
MVKELIDWLRQLWTEDSQESESSRPGLYESVLFILIILPERQDPGYGHMPKRTIRRLLLAYVLFLISYVIYHVTPILKDIQDPGADVVIAIVGLLTTPILFYFHQRHKEGD